MIALTMIIYIKIVPNNSSYSSSSHTAPDRQLHYTTSQVYTLPLGGKATFAQHICPHMFTRQFIPPFSVGKYP